MGSQCPDPCINKLKSVTILHDGIPTRYQEGFWRILSLNSMQFFVSVETDYIWNIMIS